MVTTRRGSCGGPIRDDGEEVSKREVIKRQKDKSDDCDTEPKEDTHPSPNVELLERLRKLEEELHQCREMMKRQEDVRESTNKKICTFEDFIRCMPPMYEGIDGPTSTVRWLWEMEQVFDLCDCDDSRKVKFAVRMLKGRARDWWYMMCAILEKEVIEQLSWARFAEMARKEYCSIRYVINVERELFTMKKGDLTIEEHAKRFVEKLEFVKGWMIDETFRVNTFVNTLPFCYSLTVGHAKTLYEAILKAKVVQNDLEPKKHEKRLINEKRKFEGSSRQSNKRVAEYTDKKKDTDEESLGEAQWCTRCRSCHSDQCSEKTMMCGRCGKFGHMVKDCDLKEPVCFTCQNPGHKSNKCPNR